MNDSIGRAESHLQTRPQRLVDSPVGYGAGRRINQGNCIKLGQTHVRLPESGRGAPCGRPSQGITPRTVQIVVRYRKFSTSLATGGRFLGRKKKTIGRGAPCGRPSSAILASELRCVCPAVSRTSFAQGTTVVVSFSAVPCPRSSVDRASASGAGSTGSNPVGGTFWRSETLSLLFFSALPVTETSPSPPDAGSTAPARPPRPAAYNRG